MRASTALFRNGDRCRVHNTEVTHLKTGRRVPIIGASIQTLTRLVLQNIREVPGEQVDLGKHGNPPIEGARFANVPLQVDASARMAELATLPTGKSEADEAARKKLFSQFDGNSNGYLSLAEIDGGLRHVLSAPCMAR